MATTINATYAGFRTGWNQREVRVMAKGASALTLKVGELCTLSSAGVIAKSNVGTSGKASVGNVIIAQSDMTMGKGHVPVENHNYNYSDTVSITTTPKPIMVFVVSDPEDIVMTGQDATTT